MDPNPVAHAWRCAECGRPVEADLHSCWNCGYSRNPTHLFHDLPVPLAFRIPPLRWLRRLPPFLIALTLFGAFWLAMLPLGMGLYDLQNNFVLAAIGGMFFLPGAIRRANWKHAATLGLVGIVSAFVTD